MLVLILYALLQLLRIGRDITLLRLDLTVMYSEIVKTTLYTRERPIVENSQITETRPDQDTAREAEWSLVEVLNATTARAAVTGQD
jgi:hypothetical protein